MSLWCAPLMSSKFASALFALLFFLAGCAAPASRPQSMADMHVVARDDAFALVRLKHGQTLDDVARIFLGHAREAWQISEVNAATGAAAGDVLAVPLRPANISSVYIDGFRNVPILCYHQFTDASRASHQLELSAAVFEQQLRYLLDNGYALLTFAELESILNSGRPVPEKSAIVSIDDGYRSVYDVAWPILRRYGVPATLFIYTDFIGAPAAMTWDQLREMADSGLIEVQSHGKSHTSLARLSHDASDADYSRRVREEIRGSNAVFRKRLGSAPVYLSYPYGDSSDTAARIAREEGMRLAATVTRGDNPVYAPPHFLHRSMIYSQHDMADFKRLLRTFTPISSP